MKYVVYWTWKKARPVRTKKAGEHALKAWKWWYKRQGWDVHGSAKSGYTATAPGYEPMDWVNDWMAVGNDQPPSMVHSVGLRNAGEYRDIA